MFAKELSALVVIAENSWIYLPKPADITRSDIIEKGFGPTLYQLENKESITGSMFVTYITFLLEGLETFKGIKGTVVPIRIRSDNTAMDLLVEVVSKATTVEEKLKAISYVAQKAGFSEEVTVRTVVNRVKRTLEELKKSIEVLKA